MKVWFQGPSCMSKEHYKAIHDVVNDQGFAMHYRVISNTVSIEHHSSEEYMLEASKRRLIISTVHLHILSLQYPIRTIPKQYKRKQGNKYMKSLKGNQRFFLSTIFNQSLLI